MRRNDVERAAARLRTAANEATPCPPVRDILGTDTDLDVAYATQQVNTELDIAAGRRISGRKIGLTSAAVQSQLGVHQPDFGTLFADMEVGDGLETDLGRLLQPRVEAEVAIVLGDDLDKGEHTFVDIISATAFALPAIEVVDSRVADWNITIVDTIADNASCGLYVIGGRPVPLESVDLRKIPMRMAVNGEDVSTGEGSACLGHPLHAARWLADVLCKRGTPLRAGEVVMTGALGPLASVSAGDVIEADLGPLGTVSTTMSGGE